MCCVLVGSYGIKEIKGVRRLSGEGLETKDVPGVMQGGGKWPYRYWLSLKPFVSVHLPESVE